MNEDKKNVPLDSAIKDEELDQVSGGKDTGTNKGTKRTPDLGGRPGRN